MGRQDPGGPHVAPWTLLSGWVWKRPDIAYQNTHWRLWCINSLYYRTRQPYNIIVYMLHTRMWFENEVNLFLNNAKLYWTLQGNNWNNNCEQWTNLNARGASMIVTIINQIHTKNRSQRSSQLEFMLHRNCWASAKLPYLFQVLI